MAPRRRSKIRIGVRFNEAWLNSKNDEDLKFFKQIGVDHVDIELVLIKGYKENGIFAKADLRAFIDRLGAVGLRIERANALGPYALNALLNRPEGPEGDRQPEADRRDAGGRRDPRVRHPGLPGSAARGRQPGRLEPRAGPRRLRLLRRSTLKRAEAEAPKPKYKVTRDQLWKGLINIYKQVMPTVEGSKTVIAMHGNDPPLPRVPGQPANPLPLRGLRAAVQAKCRASTTA